MYDFNDMMECYAIALYLKSFGYKAQVDSNTWMTYVQDPIEDSFVVVAIPNWDTAREFIKVRSQS
jgi:hypothetical protein